MKANTDIREYAKAKGVKLWQIAGVLHIYDSNFSRKLRFELLQEEKERIFAIIDELAEQKKTA